MQGSGNALGARSASLTPADSNKNAGVLCFLPEYPGFLEN
jgi:hypothetical protein